MEAQARPSLREHVMKNPALRVSPHVAQRPLEEWSNEDLYHLAMAMDIEGRAAMDRQTIIAAIQSR